MSRRAQRTQPRINRRPTLTRQDLREQILADFATLRVPLTGAELDTICAGRSGFAARLGAMVEHFCRLYDTDPALFRFMLIAQHDLLPGIGDAGRTPTAVVEDTVADAVAAREIARTDVAAAAAVVLGVVLQTALFHLYGRLRGPLLPRAPALARAAIAAVEALA